MALPLLLGLMALPSDYPPSGGGTRGSERGSNRPDAQWVWDGQPLLTPELVRVT